MAPVPGPPLRKVTLNLFEEDCKFLETFAGEGWTTVVREWVHQGTFRFQLQQQPQKPRTLGDLSDV